MKTNRAFSLVELMVAVGIFAILSAIATVNSLRARATAQNTAIMGAARTVAIDHVAANLGHYPQKRRWGGRKKDKFLNGKLNLALQQAGGSNVYNYRNPSSGSKQVRVGGSPGNPTAAFLLTNRNKFRYERLANNRSLLKNSKGLVIIWMSNKEPGVEVFYVDMFGKISEFHWTN